MHAYPRIPRRALRLFAAGWVALSLSACASSSIDNERSRFVTPPTTATRDASRAQLSLVHYQVYYELNLKAGAEARPVSSHGASHEAYLRWTRGEVRQLPDSSTQDGP